MFKKIFLVVSLCAVLSSHGMDINPNVNVNDDGFNVWEEFTQKVFDATTDEQKKDLLKQYWTEENIAQWSQNPQKILDWGAQQRQTLTKQATLHYALEPFANTAELIMPIKSLIYQNKLPHQILYMINNDVGPKKIFAITDERTLLNNTIAAILANEETDKLVEYMYNNPASIKYIFQSIIEYALLNNAALKLTIEMPGQPRLPLAGLIISYLSSLEKVDDYFQNLFNMIPQEFRTSPDTGQVLTADQIMPSHDWLQELALALQKM